MIKLDDLLKHFVKFCLLNELEWKIRNIAIVTSSKKHSEEIKYEFESLLSEIPEWLQPNQERNDKQVIAFENRFRLFFVNSKENVIGLRFSEVYISDDVIDTDFIEKCRVNIMHNYVQYLKKDRLW